MDMTVEEKAKQYAEETILAMYTDSELVQDFVQKLKKYAEEDFLAGYNEAMRWRDVKEELPPNPNTVFIKYETPQHLVRYGVGRYLDIRGGNPWLTYDCVNREVTHWRPIEYYKNNG